MTKAEDLTPLQWLMTVVDAERAEGVIEHRKSIRKKLTSRAAMLLAKEFSKCSDPNAAADEMVLRCWQGFKAEWFQKQEKARPRTSLEAANSILDRLENRHGQTGQGQIVEGNHDYAQQLPSAARH